MGDQFGFVKDNSAVDLNGARAVFGSPAQATQAASGALNASRSPMTIDPNSGQLSGGDYAQIPKLATPTYAQATQDQSGMQRPITQQPTTKLGSLMSVIGAAAQGAANSAGSYSFGEGFQRAQQAPVQQAMQRQQLQRSQNENEMQKAQMQNLPFLRKKAELDLQNTQSEIDLRNRSKQAPVLPKHIAEYVNDQGKKVVVFQKPDGTTEQQVLGDVNQKDPAQANSLDGAWLAGFRKDHGREPNDKEIADYRKLGAQAIHINTGAAANTAESDYNYVAEQLLKPDNLMALKDVAGRGGKERAHIFAVTSKLAQARGVKFDSGLIDQRIKFLNGYEDPKGRASLNRDAMNNILMHAGDLLDMNNNYRRTEKRFLNTPINKLSEQFGGTQFTQFDTINSVLKDEIALYFSAGYAPTEEQRATWNRIQSGTATPAQTEAFAREIARVGLRRATTHNSNFKSMMGYDDPNLIIPEASNAAEKLGLGDEVKKFGSGGRVGTSGSGFNAPPTAGGKRPPLSSFEK